MTRPIAMLFVAAGVAIGQPERGPDRGPGGRERQPERLPQDRPSERPLERWSPEQVRGELAARLERSRQYAAQLEKAITDLDAGGDPQVATGLLREWGPRPAIERGPDDGRPTDAGHDRPGWLGPRLTEEEVAAAEAFVREHVPRIAERLDAARATDAESARRMMLYLGPRIRETMRSRDRGEALFAARVEELGAMADVLDAMREFRDAARASDGAPERVEAARGRLRDVLFHQFDLNIEVQKIEIADLERQLEERRAAIARKLESRARVVEEMLRRSTGERRRGDGDGRRSDRPSGEGPR